MTASSANLKFANEGIQTSQKDEWPSMNGCKGIPNLKKNAVKLHRSLVFSCKGWWSLIAEALANVCKAVLHEATTEQEWFELELL
jgi:hypothetical protein